MCEEEFMSKLYGKVVVMLPARQRVEEAWAEREQLHPSGEFLWFQHHCPWKGHVYDLEEEQEVRGLIKFVFYQDERKMYRVQAVSQSSSSFSNRVSLCASYRGLRGEQLREVTGLADAEFVHTAGFIGGAWSLESAIKMAEASLAEDKALNPGKYEIPTESIETDQKSKAVQNKPEAPDQAAAVETQTSLSEEEVRAQLMRKMKMFQELQESIQHVKKKHAMKAEAHTKNSHPTEETATPASSPENPSNFITIQV